jgi:hypothetical protein
VCIIDSLIRGVDLCFAPPVYFNICIYLYIISFGLDLQEATEEATKKCISYLWKSD